MPNLPNRFSAYPVTTTLDANGDGSIRFQATGQNIRITNLYVSVDSRTLQATCTMYKNQVGPSYAIKNTNSGSTGAAATGSIDLLDGEAVYVVWGDGDPGATATATFSGSVLPFDIKPESNDSFLWDDPIAAGDGSLIYPGLQSINYIPGTTGWRIDRNGDVDMNAGAFRGSVIVRAADGSSVEILPTDGGKILITPEAAPDVVYFDPAGLFAGYASNAGGFTFMTIDTAQMNDNGNIVTAAQLFMSSTLGNGTAFAPFTESAPTFEFNGSISLENQLVNASDNLFYARGERNTSSFNLAAVTNATNTITFANAFQSAPTVTTNIRSGSGQVRGWGSRAINVTTTGFDLFIFSPLTTSPTATVNPLLVDWIALTT